MPDRFFSLRRSVASLLPSSCFTAAAGMWRTLHLAHASPLRDVGEGLVRGSIGRMTLFRVFFFRFGLRCGPHLFWRLPRTRSGCHHPPRWRCLVGNFLSTETAAEQLLSLRAQQSRLQIVSSISCERHRKEKAGATMSSSSPDEPYHQCFTRSVA